MIKKYLSSNKKSLKVTKKVKKLQYSIPNLTRKRKTKAWKKVRKKKNKMKVEKKKTTR